MAPRSVRGLLVLLLVVNTAGAGRPPEEPGPNDAPVTKGPLTLTLGTTKPKYLIGEPIVLTARLENHSEHAVLAVRIVEEDFPEEARIKVYVASGRQPLQECRDGHGMISCPGVHPGLEYLTRERPWCLKRAILRDERQARQLAFAEPGTYRARVQTHLAAVVADEAEVVNFWTNPVSFEVVAPQGDDALVWEQIQSDPDSTFALTVLQVGLTGSIRYRYGKQPKLDPLMQRWFDLYMRFPDTTYAPVLRERLTTYYTCHHRRLSESVKASYRRELGVFDDRFFPDDPRLNQKIEVQVDLGKPLTERLAELTMRTGVPLRADANVSAHRFPTRGFPLRSWLADMQREGMLAWSRDGEVIACIASLSADSSRRMTA